MRLPLSLCGFARRCGPLVLALVAVGACSDGGGTPSDSKPDPVVGSVVGTVSVEGDPAAGVAVGLSDGASTTTDEAGAFAFGGIDAGSHLVSISGYPDDAAFADTVRSATISARGQEVTVDFDGTYIRTASVTGSVRVAESPVTGATLTLEGRATGSATTGEDGRYAFTELRAGEYSVELIEVPGPAAALAFESTEATVTVGVGETAVVDFGGSSTVAAVSVTPPAVTLTFGSTLQLEATALDASGAALPGVTAAWASDAEAVATVDDEGAVEAVGVGSGRIVATVYGVEGSAEIVVEPRIHALTAPAEAVVPGRGIRIALPDDAPDARGVALPGSMGGRDVLFGILDARTLTLLVPDLDPGPRPARVELGPNDRGEFTLTVLAGPEIADPDVLVSSAVDDLEAGLDGLPSAGASDRQRMQSALAEFRSRYDAASEEDRRTVARIVAANEGLFRLEIRGAVAAPVPSALASYELEGAGGLRDVDAHREVLSESEATAEALANRCRDQSTSSCIAASLMGPGWFGRAKRAAISLAESLAALLYRDGPPRAVRFRNAGSGTRGAPPAGSPGIDVHTAAIDAADSIVSGETYAVELVSTFRTISPADAEGSGLLEDFFGAAGRLREMWDGVRSTSDRLSEATSVDVTIDDELAVHADPPVADTFVIPAESLTLLDAGEDSVSCTGGPEEEEFRLTCALESMEPRELELRFVYRSELQTDTLKVGTRLTADGSCRSRTNPLLPHLEWYECFSDEDPDRPVSREVADHDPNHSKCTAGVECIAYTLWRYRDTEANRTEIRANFTIVGGDVENYEYGLDAINEEGRPVAQGRFSTYEHSTRPELSREHWEHRTRSYHANGRQKRVEAWVCTEQPPGTLAWNRHTWSVNDDTGRLVESHDEPTTLEACKEGKSVTGVEPTDLHLFQKHAEDGGR